MKTLDIKRDDPRHKKVMDALIARRDLSRHSMVERHKKWNKSEEDFVAYIPANSVEAKKKAERENKGEQNFTKIVVPYAYSMMMTAHTYFCSTLLARNPVFQYMAAHGEPEMNVLANEALVAYQMREEGNLAALYLWLMDACKYGLGVTCSYWEEDMHYVSSFEETPVTVAGIPLPGRTQVTRRVREIPGYQGNRIFNVSPYKYLPDPRVPLTQVNRGEFAGREIELSFNDIMTGKLQGRYIEKNAEYVLERMKSGGVGKLRDDYHSSQIVLPGDNAHYSGVDPKTGLSEKVEAVEMVVEVIPKLWGLGGTEYPEKWVFTFVDDHTLRVLLAAKPYGMIHDRFPFSILEYEMDAYALFNRSMLDVGRPLNEVMTWLFNSHFFNVERSMFGELVYDPTKVHQADVLDPKPGKRIRLRPSAYGTDVRTAIHSLGPDAGATANNLRDMSGVMELMQQALGISEGLLGNLPSGRQSATASRIATTASTSRMKTIVEYFSATGFQTLSLNLLETGQQMYDAQKKFRIAGDLPNNAQAFIDVSPETIAGSFEYAVVDGSLPMDRTATVNMWAQLLNQFKQFPGLAERYDVSKIIGWVMQQGGIRNLKQFQIDSQSPEVIAAEAAKGNLVPMSGGSDGGGLGSGGGYGRPSGTEEDLSRDSAQVPNPGQSGGMGRTV